jgi:hypothetical protein
MSRYIDRERIRPKVMVRREENDEYPENYNPERRKVSGAFGVVIGAALLGGLGGLIALFENEGDVSNEVAGGLVESNPKESNKIPRLSAKPMVNPVNIEPQLRVLESVRSEARAMPSLKAKVDMAIPDKVKNSLRATVKTEVPGFDYAEVVEKIVTAAYQPEKLYSDEVNVRPEIERQIREFRNHPDQDIRRQAWELGQYYLEQIVRVVRSQGNLDQALRFADLAARLNPELVSSVMNALSEAININEAMIAAKRSLRLELEPSATAVINNQPTPVGNNEFKIDLNKQIGPESPSQAENEVTAKNTVVVDQAVVEEVESQRKMRILPPGVLWSLGVEVTQIAGILQRHIDIGLNIAGISGSNYQGEQVWRAVNSVSLTVALGEGAMGAIKQVTEFGIGASGQGLTLDVLKTALAAQLNKLRVVSFEQQSVCMLSPDSPCRAMAIVYEDLVVPGIEYRINTLGGIVVMNILGN